MHTTYFRSRLSGHIVSHHGELAADYRRRPEQWQRLKPDEGKRLYITQTAEKLQKDLRFNAVHGKTTLFCVVRSVAKSGLSRTLDFFLQERTNGHPDIRWISYPISVVLGWRMSKDRGVIVDGNGMDMAFHTVDCLQRSLPELEAHKIELVSRIL